MFSPDKYSVLYKTDVDLIIDKTVINVSTSDIVSIAYICNYDTMTYPIIRVRLYSDLSIIQELCDKPDLIHVKINMDANVYRLSQNNDSPVPVSKATSVSIYLKGYIENKNIPTSVMDQYKDGTKTKNDLNEEIKYPIEIFLYDDEMIHKTKDSVQSIYKDTSLKPIIESMVSAVQKNPIHIDPLDNQEKYHQVLIPGMNFVDAIAYIERYYGIYKKGTQVFMDVDGSYISSIDTSMITSTINPIYVSSSYNNSDLIGLRKDTSNNSYKMFVLFNNVSVLTETDIEKTINGSYVSDINVKNGQLNVTDLDKKLKDNELISVPKILHSYQNQFVSDMMATSINERITRIDMTGTGFDVFSLKNNSRYNFIFESPIRGFDINRLYRASFATHVFSNLDTDLFIAQSSFTMCTN